MTQEADKLVEQWLEADAAMERAEQAMRRANAAMQKYLDEHGEFVAGGKRYSYSSGGKINQEERSH